MSFKSLGLSSAIISKLRQQDFTAPSPIQSKAIPAILKGQDLLGIAQTGSGKTLAYGLPLLMKLVGDEDYKNRHAKALVLVPTRELAQQVHQVIELYTQNLQRRVKTMAVYGGVSINPQMIGLQNVELLVATPGRLLDLTTSKAIRLSEVRTFVMDEADKLLNLGFKEELNEILNLLPSHKQCLLFSATLSEDVQNIKALLLKDPVIINITPDKENVELIRQESYLVTEEKKGPFLRYLIKEQHLEQVLVFTSSGKNAEKVAHKLMKNGIDASPIHGKLSQGARSSALSRFKSKTLRVLVATDLLSRGIDIPLMPCIINYELPRSPKDFIHRIGRTGRAGSPGLAISILTSEDLHHFKVIQKKMGLWATITETEEINLHGY